MERITPACAGISFHGWELPSMAWDHPRMRGDKSIKLLDALPRLGSPPHARG